jgi:hypothetical protein
MADDSEKKEDKTLLQKIGGVILDFADWLGQERAYKAIVDDMGLDLKKAPQFPPLTLTGIKDYVTKPSPGLEAWFGVIADVRKLYEGLRSMYEAIDLGAEATAEETFQTFIDLLASNYVRDRWFHLYVWMEFARFSTEPMTLYGPQGTAAERFYGSLKALLKFVLAPVTLLKGPAMKTEADARKWSDSTFQQLAGVFAFIGHSEREIGLATEPLDDGHFKMFYGFDQPAGALTPEQLASPAADAVSQRMLSVQVRELPKSFQGGTIQIEGALRFSFAWVPEEHGGKGLFIAIGGTGLKFNVDSGGDWTAQADATFPAPFNIQLGGKNDSFAVDTPNADPQVHVGLTLASKPLPPGERRRILSFGGDNGFDIGRIALSGTLATDDARVELTFYDCRLALDGASFDNFIGSMLPTKQTSVEFTFGVGASSRDGLFTTGDLPFVGARGGAPKTSAKTLALTSDTTSGSGGAQAGNEFPNVPVVATGLQGGGIPLEIPIGKSIGPVRLLKVLLNLDRDTAGAAPKTLIQAGLSFSTQIGPVVATVDRIGMKFGLDFPDDRSKANLHFANVDLGFIPPKGIGLAVDAKSVKGGGFLFHDEGKHQYAGVMELSLSGVVALKAIGLLSTRLPDGSKGYSLLIMVTAQSAKEGGSLWELPLGWRLTGLGGLIAIHRTVDEDAVRAGLKNHTLASILFPKDPVANAPTILAAIDRVFPARRGSYLFGLMVQLQWGVPTLIEVNLGLIVELGGRNRFVVLGRITAILPRKEDDKKASLDNDLLRINLDALGIFDFDQGTAAIDALLVDSRFLRRFTLTGGGAMRARWTSPRSFALAVGGLHHGFTPPAGFPSVDRIQVDLTTGDNPQLTCNAYFALTSNTVQFGARAHLYASAGGFSITGDAGFDVLIQLLPFHFLAEFFAGMQLKRGSTNLFKVKVEGALEGPLPLSVRAKCTFEIFWWDVTVRVNFTLVSGQAPPLPAAIDAFAQLRLALADAKSWTTELPQGQTRIVSLRESVADGTLRVHPLGTLTVRQSVVPLNLSRDIDKFNDSPIAGARRFTVTRVAVGTGTGTEATGPVQDDFAPAQFFDMSDDDKLASPSFEPMQAGLRFGASEFAFAVGQCVGSPLEYETRVVDRNFAVPTPPPTIPYVLSLERLRMHAMHGAAGRSSLRREERRAAVQPFVKVEPPRFAAVNKDLALLADAKRDATFSEALSSAMLKRRGMVVNDFELAKIKEPA